MGKTEVFLLFHSYGSCICPLLTSYTSAKLSCLRDMQKYQTLDGYLLISDSVWPTLSWDTSLFSILVVFLFFFFSCRCTSARAFCYRSYYATVTLDAISVLKLKDQNGSSTINQLTRYICTSLCPICLSIVTSDLNLGLSLSAQIVNPLRQGLHPVFVEGNELLIPVSCYYQHLYKR